jgi:radical SAM protein with 4Fe4S-binding SPASM domain
MKKFKRIYLELTGACNLSCPFCEGGIRRDVQISPDRIRELIPKIAEFTDEIRPHVLGEPMMYPHFELFAELCEENGAAVKITTNGTMTDPVSVSRMSSRCVKEVNFSLQSFSPETHGCAASYVDSLFSYAENARELGRGQYINFRFWTMSEGRLPQEQIPVFTRLCERYGLSPDAALSDVRNRSLRLSERRRVSFDETFEWPSLSHTPVSDRGFCHGASSHIAILSDGRVVPCCLDAEGVMTIGNAFEDDLRNIASCGRLESIRAGFARGERTEELCRRCSFCSRFVKK